MSFDTIAAVFEHSRAKGLARLVLLHLANRADERGECYPSVTRMVQEIGVSRRAIQKQLAKLVALGELKCSPRAGMKVNGGATNLFRVTIKKAPKKGASLAQPMRTTCAEGSAPDAHEPVSLNQSEHLFLRKRARVASTSVTATRSSLPIGFDELTEDEQEIVTHYNKTLPPMGWFPVTRVTENLRQALAIHEGDWLRLISDVASNPPDEWPKRRTLVRLCWDAY